MSPRLSIREQIEKATGKKPCLWQVDAIRAQLSFEAGIVVSAPTGMGKTLALFGPSLLEDKTITIMVTPLNDLGVQMEETLNELGIPGAVFTAATTTAEKIKRAELGEYRVIVINPEMLGGATLCRLLGLPIYAKRFKRLIFDEAHVVNDWGTTFRAAYRSLNFLRNMYPALSIVFASATLTEQDISALFSMFRIKKEAATIIRRSNDRPNINIIVKPMQFSKKSMHDIICLLPLNPSTLNPPAKFVVFFDSRKRAQDAAALLQSYLLPEDKHRIRSVNSVNSPEERKKVADGLRTGALWGLTATDVFGMGMDIPDILVVAQHGVPELEKANTQRAGRAVRDRSLQGTFLLFTEPKYDVGGYPSKRKKKGKAAKRKAADHAAGPPIKKRGMRDDKRPAGLQDDDDDDVQVKEEEMEVELGEDVEEDEAEDGGEDMEGNANPDDDGDGEGIEQSQRQTYGRKRGQKKPARRVDQTLVDLVETDGCRRKIQDEHYGNNNLPTPEPCCDRCNPTPAAENCGACDNCKPELKTGFVYQPIPLSVKRPAMRKLDPAEDDQHDTMLRERLKLWADGVAKAVFNDCVLFDGEAIMSSDIVERIVRVERAGLLDSETELESQTHWCFASQYAGDVFRIVEELRSARPTEQIRPALQPSNTKKKMIKKKSIPMQDPLPPAQSTSTVANPPARRQCKCSYCGQPGHNVATCPKRVADGVVHTKKTSKKAPTRNQNQLASGSQPLPSAQHTPMPTIIPQTSMFYTPNPALYPPTHLVPIEIPEVYMS